MISTLCLAITGKVNSSTALFPAKWVNLYLTAVELCGNTKLKFSRLSLLISLRSSHLPHVSLQQHLWS
jgi:hypothetical protein